MQKNLDCMARFFVMYELLEHPLQILVFDHPLIPGRLERDLYLDGNIRNGFEHGIPHHLLEHVRHRTERCRERHQDAHKFFFRRKFHLVDQS